MFKQRSNLPAFVTNKYFLVILAFVVWMLFFDRNNMILQYKRQKELSDLEAKKEYYEAEIEQIIQDKEEIFGSNENKEKFAREKYRMKKPDEDIFVIVEEKK